MTLTGSAKTAYVFAEDLDDEALDTVKQICGDTFDNPPTSGLMYGELARRIRSELDKRMGTRGWSCVVGRSYGAFITQKIKCYAYLSVYPGVNILVWKA